MAVTRIKNNQITDLTITNAKLANTNITGGKLSNDLVYGSNLTVSGNLTVNGTTVTVDTTNTVVSDPLMVLSKNAAGAASVDSGYVVERGTDQNVAWIWDESADEFAAIFTTEVGTTAGDVAIAGYANIHMAALEVTSADMGNISISGNTIASTDTNGNIVLDPNGTGEVQVDNAVVTGGTIDGTAIGGTTPAAGAFTTLESTGLATLASAAVTGNMGAATISTSGLATLASAAVVGAATVGTTLEVTGHTTMSTASTSGLATLASASVTGAATVGSTLGVTGLATFTAGADMTGDVISNVATPVAATDGANKAYVDSVAAGGFTLTDSTNSTTISGGDTLTVSGTAGEVDVLVGSGADTFQIGLPTNVSVAGTFGAGGLASFAGVNASGNVDITGTLDSGAATVSTLEVTGLATVGSTLGVTGHTTMSTASTSGLGTFNTLSVTNAATVGGTLNVVDDLSVATSQFTVDAATGNVDAAGTLGVTGNTTLLGTLTATIGDSSLAGVSATSIKDSALTATRVVYATTDGELTDSANMTFSGTVLDVTGEVTVDNLSLDGNTVSSTDTNGNVVISPNGTGVVDVDSSLISNVTDPSGPQDAATKAYVDSQSATGWTLSDGGTTQVISGGDTVLLQGTTNEINVAVTATDTMTIGLPDDVTIADQLTVVGGATVGTNMVITGNLTVQGTTTTVESVTTVVADPIFTIGTGSAAPVVDDGKDRGISFDHYDTAARVGYFGMDNSTGKFTYIPQATIAAEVVSGTVGGAAFADLSISGLTEDQVVYAGANGELTTSANYTFDGSAMALTGTSTITGQLSVDNVTINGNAITSTDTNGNIEITPDGTGIVVISNADINAGTIDGTVIGGSSPAAGTFTTLDSTGLATLDSASVTGAATVGTTLGVTGLATLGSASVTGAATVGTTLGVTGHTSLSTLGTSGLATLNSASITGGATVGTTLGVTGAASFSNTASVSGDFDVATNKFTVNSTTGDTVVAGTLNAGASTLASGGFTGNASVGGTLTVTGTTTAAAINATAIGGTTITTSGNGSIGGTLGVTGVATFTAGADMTGDRITSVADPLAAQDAATKAYVDSVTSSGWTISDGSNTSVISGSDTLTVSGTASEVEVSVGASLDTMQIGLPDNVEVAGTLGSGGLATLASASITANASVGGTLGVTGHATMSTFGASGNATVGGTLGVTGDITGAGITGSSVTDSGLTATRVTFASTGGLLADSGDFTYTTGTGALSVTGSITADNVVLDGNDITVASGTELTVNEAAGDVNFRVEGTGDANVLFVDAGQDNVGIKTALPNAEASLHINGTDSMIVPVGTTAQRPATPVTGMYRYNSTTGSQEIWDGIQWSGGVEFTVITTDAFAGDDSTTEFTLGAAATTAGVIVCLNGVVQIPTTAYGVSGTTLTFTEAPATGDVIDCRTLTTTTTITGLSGSGGTLDVSGSTVAIDGDALELTDGTAITFDETGTSVGTSAGVVDSFVLATYRSAKYVVQVSNGSDFQVSEALVIHDGTTASLTAYAEVYSNANMGSLSVAVNGANIELSFTGVSAGNTIKVMPSYIAV